MSTDRTMTDDQLLRYSRQLLLPELDVAGQQRLRASRVAVFGLGGLGAPVTLYLAAAGIGELHLVDPDTVDVSNLQRQLLFRTADQGQRKTAAARRTLQALNPEPELAVYSESLAPTALLQLCDQVDLIIDGTDNFVSRDQLNSASRETGTPLVFGAAIRLEGQLTVFAPKDPTSPCYRCLHPQIGDDQDRCAESGVLGPVVGTIGTLMATEALKLLAGFGTPAIGRLLHYDASSAEFHSFKLPRFAACPTCGTAP